MVLVTVTGRANPRHRFVYYVQGMLAWLAFLVVQHQLKIGCIYNSHVRRPNGDDYPITIRYAGSTSGRSRHSGIGPLEFPQSPRTVALYPHSLFVQGKNFDDSTHAWVRQVTFHTWCIEYHPVHTPQRCPIVRLGNWFHVE